MLLNYSLSEVKLQVYSERIDPILLVSDQQALLDRLDNLVYLFDRDYC